MVGSPSQSSEAIVDLGLNICYMVFMDLGFLIYPLLRTYCYTHTCCFLSSRLSLLVIFVRNFLVQILT